MRTSRLGPQRLAIASVLTVLVWLVLRALRGRRSAVFEATTTEPVAWPELPALRDLRSDPAAADVGADAAPDDVVAPAPDAPVVETEPSPPLATTDATGPTGAALGWVEPGPGGSCPPGFPVKAKLSSGIFHVPEGAFYGRTVPDRCYVDGASAEADGLRRSKR